ncbi:MAG: NAD(+) synthase [Spirochaetales bacterium]|nr:NAD(+) synthase [Spirochaetales bacterium]
MIIKADAMQIDPDNTVNIILNFINAKMGKLRRNGIVVPVSGGLDSSVVAALCVKAVGKEKVTGLLLPEKQGNPDAVPYAGIIAGHLGIKTVKIDISKILKAAGAYNFVLSRIPTRQIREKLVRAYLNPQKESMFIKGVKGTQNKFLSHGIASYYIKQRIRLVVVYKYAEENNLLVAGSAHKSEDLVGLYVKFGVDDIADIMPLKNLFRTHIVQLARFLKIPDAIVSRTPNPDLVPGVTDKYRDILHLDAEKVDFILYNLSKKAAPEEIAQEAGVAISEVEKISELVRLTSHMRNPSMAPDIPIP